MLHLVLAESSLLSFCQIFHDYSSRENIIYSTESFYKE